MIGTATVYFYYCLVALVLLLLCGGESSTVGSSLFAAAEVPPLSMKELVLYSDHIFLGIVTASEFKDVPNRHHSETWANRHWRLNVTVTKVYKTLVNPHNENLVAHDDERCWEQQEIHVMMWKAWKRPFGVTGPGGVGMLPEVGDEVGFFTRYLHRDPQRRNMYEESFPHVDDESELAAAEGNGDIELPPLPPSKSAKTRRTLHKKAYNALTPNGIQSKDEVVSSDVVELVKEHFSEEEEL